MQWLKHIWSAVWRILLFAVLWGALWAPLLYALGLLRAGGPRSNAIWLAVEATGMATILIAAWLMTRFADRRRFVTLGFGRTHLLGDTLCGIGLGLAMMAACAGLLMLSPWAEFRFERATPATALLLPVLAVAANSVTQEVLVRGYILQTLRTRFGAGVAVIVSSLVFVLLHAGALSTDTLVAGLNLFLSGVFLGLAYVLTGNLWFPIAAHFGWNFLQGPVLGAAVSGRDLGSTRLLDIDPNGPSLMTGGAFGPEGGLAATAATLLGIATLWLLYRPRT